MKPAIADLLALYRALGMLERDAVCCGDVSVAQCFALQLLLAEEHDGSGMAKAMGVTKGAVTRLMSGLESRGFVRRRTDKEDRRRSWLSLTAKGRAKAQALEALTEEMIGQALGGIPKEKRAQVVESIGLLRAALESQIDAAEAGTGS